jgi:hypothetical protein
MSVAEKLIPPLGRQVRTLVVGLGTLLLFSVKLNFIKFSGETSGLRVDDLVLLGVGFLLAVSFAFLARTVISPLELQALGVFLVFFASNLFNRAVFGESNFLYSLRFLEYFLFFYIGYYYAARHSLKSAAGWLLAANAIVMILQKLGLVGGYDVGGYVATASDRVIGLTGGPWEVGAVVNFCFAVLLERTKEKAFYLRNLGLFLFTFTLVLLTGSRMPALAHVCIFLIFLVRGARRPTVVLISSSVCLLLFLILIFTVPNPIKERSTDLISSRNLDLALQVYRDASPSVLITEISDENQDEGIDASWAVRVVKWCFVLKLWTITPSAWFIGLGPGICGPALDGSWLRLVVETGCIGTLMFAVLLWRCASLDPAMRSVVIALSISMLMIDIHLAYKAMSFFFFATGCYYRNRQRNPESARVSALSKR